MSGASGATSPCGGCDARCCRSYTVYLTGVDAWRIAAATGREPATFLAYLPQAVRTDAGFLLEPGGPTFDLVLRTAPPEGDPRSPCVFLRTDGPAGDGRCTIHPVRPGACRRFPAVRRDDGGVGVRDGIVCPAGAWDGHPMDRLYWRVALERERRDAELHAVVVAEWNARVEAGRGRAPRTVEAYLDHLSDAWSWIDHMRRALRPGERAGPGLLLRVGEVLHDLPAV